MEPKQVRRKFLYNLIIAWIIYFIIVSLFCSFIIFRDTPNSIMGWLIYLGVSFVIAFFTSAKSTVEDVEKAETTIYQGDLLSSVKNNNKDNKYENLEKLQKLKDSGIITEEEFNKEKERILR